jgi:Cell Wall Hydrolase
VAESFGCPSGGRCQSGVWVSNHRSIAYRVAGCVGLMLVLAGIGGAARVGLPPQTLGEGRAPITPAVHHQPLSPVDRPVAEAADPLAAQEINARIPVSRAPVEAAAPFSLAGRPQDRARAEHCLTLAIYYEAAFEPDQGQRAVAQVVLNRVRHPEFPKTVCGVVFQGARLPICQFSFTCDGAMTRTPQPAAWTRAQRAARAALDGHVEASVGSATHYHADYVAPYWGPRLTKIRQIGAHIFYRWPGQAGRKVAFVGRHAGHEPPPILTAAMNLGAEPLPSLPPPDPTDRRAENDVGGRIVPGLGWTPSVPIITSEGAYARTLSGHEARPSAPAAPAQTAGAT